MKWYNQALVVIIIGVSCFAGGYYKGHVDGREYEFDEVHVQFKLLRQKANTEREKAEDMEQKWNEHIRNEPNEHNVAWPLTWSEWER